MLFLALLLAHWVALDSSSNMRCWIQHTCFKMATIPWRVAVKLYSIWRGGKFHIRVFCSLLGGCRSLVWKYYLLVSLFPQFCAITPVVLGLIGCVCTADFNVILKPMPTDALHSKPIIPTLDATEPQFWCWPHCCFPPSLQLSAVLLEHTHEYRPQAQEVCQYPWFLTHGPPIPHAYSADCSQKREKQSARWFLTGLYSVWTAWAWATQYGLWFRLVRMPSRSTLSVSGVMPMFGLQALQAGAGFLFCFSFQGPAHGCTALRHSHNTNIGGNVHTCHRSFVFRSM